MNRLTQVLCCILFSLSMIGQEALSFDQALEMALAENHDIRMARIDEDIAENNTSLGNNGYLPSISASGAYNWTYNEGSFDLRNGETNRFDPNAAYNYSAGVTLSYTLFDGLARRFQYKQQQWGALSTQAQVGQLLEQTILEVTQAYSAALAAVEQEQIYTESLDISASRLQRAEYGLEYGQSTRLDVLNARVDLDVDSVNLINAQLQKEEAVRNLNLLMGQSIDSQWALNEDMAVREDIQQTEALEQALERNSQIKLAELGLRETEASLGASKGSWWPRLSANLNYDYRGTDDPNGAFVIGQGVFGPSAGLGMSWDLFNGQNNTRIQNAKLQLEQQVIAQEATELGIRREVLNAHARYQNALFIRQTQEQRVETAARNFERSAEALKNGQLTSLEYRQAQVNLLNAQLQQLQAGFDAKQAEMLVLSLMGALVK